MFHLSGFYCRGLSENVEVMHRGLLDALCGRLLRRSVLQVARCQTRKLHGLPNYPLCTTPLGSPVVSFS